MSLDEFRKYAKDNDTDAIQMYRDALKTKDTDLLLALMNSVRPDDKFKTATQQSTAPPRSSSQPIICNDRTVYYQNRGEGNCLFEAVSQIFFPYMVTDKENYNSVDGSTAILRELVFKFYQAINFFNGFEKYYDAAELREKNAHSRSIQNNYVWGVNDDLQILSFLFKFNFRIVNETEQVRVLQNSYANKYSYQFCNTILGAGRKGNHWVLKKELADDPDKGVRYDIVDFYNIIETCDNYIAQILTPMTVDQKYNLYQYNIVLLQDDEQKLPQAAMSSPASSSAPSPAPAPAEPTKPRFTKEDIQKLKTEVYPEINEYKTLILTPTEIRDNKDGNLASRAVPLDEYRKQIEDIGENTPDIHNKRTRDNYYNLKGMFDIYNDNSNLIVINIRGNGGCFYNCIVYFFLRYCNFQFRPDQTEQFVHQFKEKVINDMTKNPTSKLRILCGEEKCSLMDQLMPDIRNDDIPDVHFVLNALTNTYYINIIIISFANSNIGFNDVKFNGDTLAQMNDSQIEASGDKETLVLIIQRVHYNLILHKSKNIRENRIFVNSIFQYFKKRPLYDDVTHNKMNCPRYFALLNEINDRFLIKSEEEIKKATIFDEQEKEKRKQEEAARQEEKEKRDQAAKDAIKQTQERKKEREEQIRQQIEDDRITAENLAKEYEAQNAAERQQAEDARKMEEARQANLKAAEDARKAEEAAKAKIKLEQRATEIAAREIEQAKQRAAVAAEEAERKLQIEEQKRQIKKEEEAKAATAAQQAKEEDEKQAKDRKQQEQREQYEKELQQQAQYQEQQQVQAATKAEDAAKQAAIKAATKAKEDAIQAEEAAKQAARKASRQAEEAAKQAARKASRQAEEDARKLEEAAKQAEENARQAEEAAKQAEENARKLEEAAKHATIKAEENARKAAIKAESAKLNLKMVNIIIFVKTSLLICLNNDKSNKYLFKSPCGPVDVFDLNKPDNEAFNETMQQTGLDITRENIEQNPLVMTFSTFNETLPLNTLQRQTYVIYLNELPEQFQVDRKYLSKTIGIDKILGTPTSDEKGSNRWVLLNSELVCTYYLTQENYFKQKGIQRPFRNYYLKHICDNIESYLLKYKRLENDKYKTAQPQQPQSPIDKEIDEKDASMESPPTSPPLSQEPEQQTAVDKRNIVDDLKLQLKERKMQYNAQMQLKDAFNLQLDALQKIVKINHLPKSQISSPSPTDVNGSPKTLAKRKLIIQKQKEDLVARDLILTMKTTSQLYNLLKTEKQQQNTNNSQVVEEVQNKIDFIEKENITSEKKQEYKYIIAKFQDEFNRASSSITANPSNNADAAEKEKERKFIEAIQKLNAAKQKEQDKEADQQLKKLENFDGVQVEIRDVFSKLKPVHDNLKLLSIEIKRLQLEIIHREEDARTAQRTAVKAAAAAAAKATTGDKMNPLSIAAGVLFLKENMKTLSLNTNTYIFIIYICIIILLSLLLHYQLMEYTPFLILMCVLLGGPIIGYLLMDSPPSPGTTTGTQSTAYNPKKYYILFVIFMIVMTIFTYMLLFNRGKLPDTPMPQEPTKAEDEMNAIIIFSIIAFLLLLMCIAWFSLSVSEFKDLFENVYQISNIIYVIAYICFLVVFIYLTPKNFQTDYAYIITPLLILLGMVAFMYSFKQTPLFTDSIINVTYERLKYFILLVCLIVVVIIFYAVDFGGFMTTYFGQTFPIAIAMMVFGFLFLLFSVNLSDSANPAKALTSIYSRDKFMFYNITVCIIFTIIAMAGIVYFPGGFQNDPIHILIITMLLIVFIGWILFFGVNLFANEKGELVKSISSFSNETKYDAAKRILIMVFGLIFSSLFIVWVVTTFQEYASRSTLAAGILNTIMIIFALSLIYKILTIGQTIVKPPTQFKKGIALILSIAFYIPCLITSPFEVFSQTTSLTGDDKLKKYEYSANLKNACIVFVLFIILWVISLILPFIEKRVSLQGGTQIIAKPIPTNSELVVASHEKLNGNNDSQYQYGMSFWVFINAFSPSTNSNYNKFTSLLNYGDKPNILYNGNTNTMMITMKNTGLTNLHNNPNHSSTETNNNQNHKLTDLDENNNRILYKEKNVLLQKWNNITLNYTGGTLDIFVNGKLVKSNIEVIPYMTLDNLTVGTNHGIEGGICNLVYFTKPLTITNVYYLYETLKNTTPPFIETL